MDISNIMKITDQIQHLFHPKPTTKELYLSLTLLHQHIVGCVWSIGQDEILDTIAFSYRKSGDTSWGKRIEAADEVLTTLQDTAKTMDIHKTVLGFSQEFLTKDGNIDPANRQELKRLTTMLELKPVGFVEIDTAMIFHIKHEEGVPPSVILLHVVGQEIQLSLYRVGTCVGNRTIQAGEFIVEDVETAIKSFSDIEILPSRMILYGAEKDTLDVLKSQLLTHPWTSRANFLHYPTIDIFQFDDISYAVALAGASELTATFIDVKEDSVDTSTTVVAQQQQGMSEDHGDVDDVSTATESLLDDENNTEETEDAEEREISEIHEEDEISEIHEEDNNVISVEPEILGFRQNIDVLEKPEETSRGRESKRQEVFDTTQSAVSIKNKVVVALRSFWSNLRGMHILKHTSHVPILPIVLVVLFIVGSIGLGYYFIPKVDVTLTVLPHVIRKEKTITIAQTATEVDTTKFIVPGKKIEQSVTGEKTSPVIGKKKIGDPAKGTVVIYNKATSSRTLKKGLVLVSDSLQVTLDNDVEIASASESIGSITFGKTSASVTATSIGEEGNIAAGAEFTFKDISSSVLIARNDQPFVGGVSRETTVVSRSDYDTMIKALTDELVTKAKSDLLAGITGSEKLIDETIKTAVTSKIFTEELDQEAKELHGKITITISGISYNEQDVKSLLLTLTSGEVPSGYVTNDGRTVVSVNNPTIKKDGSITVSAAITHVSIPTIDVATVQKKLKGKTIKSAEEIIKNIQGVGGVEFFFGRSLIKNRFPIKDTNIGVDVVVG